VIYNPIELARIVAMLEATATTLEFDLVAALSLRPIAATVALVKVGHTVWRIRRLQAAVISAGLHYNQLEGNLPNRMQALLGGTVHALAGALATRLVALPLVGETRVAARPVSGWFATRTPDSLPAMVNGLVAAENRHRPVIRIEQVFGSATRQFVVYLPGTQQWSPIATRNPLDLGSNLQAFSGAGRAGSERAVSLAMRQAGIGKLPSDRVLFVGFSQGALIGANLASTAQSYKVTGLVSLGGPISQVQLPQNLPVLALEHKADPVPKLDGGTPQNTGQHVTLTRDRAVDPAHNLKNYRVTAEALNLERSAAARRVIDGLIPESGYTQARWFELERVAD
jgi:hypothetical protein